MFLFAGFLGGGPGTSEIVVIFLVILVLFGPRRLPEAARLMGRILSSLRRASQDFKNQIMSIDDGSEGDMNGGDVSAATAEFPYHESSEELDEVASRPGESEGGDDSRLAG